MKVSATRNTMPKPQPGPRRLLPPPTGLERFGGHLAMLFVFLIYSRLHEYIPVRMHLPVILSAVLFGIALLTGGVPRAFSSRPGVLLTGFTCWFVLSIPFSFWKSNSLELLVRVYSYALLCFVVVTALIRTFSQLRQLAFVIAAGACLITAMTLVYGADRSGRTSISSEISGTLSNANDVALYLIFGLPFCALIAGDPRRSRVVRILAGFASLLMAYATLRTGSRMGFLGLIVLFLLFLLHGSLKRALTGAAALAAVAMLLLTVLPEETTIRYRSLFQSAETLSTDTQQQEDSEKALGQLDKATASARNRKAAIKAGVMLTLRHPLFGVGPGQFGVAMAQQPESGLAYIQPHNTYTQLSSETGIPGFLMYAWAVAYSIRAVYRIYKTTKGRADLTAVSRMAYSLLACFVTFAVVGMFGHLAYGFMWPVLCALAVVIERSAPEWEAAAVPAAPQPAFVRPLTRFAAGRTGMRRQRS